MRMRDGNAYLVVWADDEASRLEEERFQNGG